MVYLPTFYHKNQPNVGKYTYHTWMVWVLYRFDWPAVLFGGDFSKFPLHEAAIPNIHMI